MKVLVLAGGRSTRMAPIKEKFLLDFMGKSLMQHQLEILKENGFKDVVIIGREETKPRFEEIIRELGISGEVVIQGKQEGMCGAILSAKEQIEGEPVLIFNSNDVVDGKAFADMQEAIEKDLADSIIVGKRVKEYFPGGYLEVDRDGYIEHLIEKPGEGNEPSDLVNIVIHYHSKTNLLLEYLEKVESKNDDLYEVALAEMMKDGVKMKALAYDGFWQAIKYPWHVQNVFRYLISGNGVEIHPEAEVAEGVIIKGDVLIGDGVKIFEGAVIKGPAFIGKGSVVANNALVRDAHVGAGSVIGFNSEIARSYLGREVWTHSNYIGDSVIGNNVAFGAGAVTGNFRLDEANVEVCVKGEKVDCKTNKFGLVTGDGVRVGVNVSTMPGVKIGGGSFVGAGIVLAQDVPEKSFVRGKWELKVSENRVEMEEGGREDLMDGLKG